MPSFPKNTPYRNQKLRDLAAECPQCMYCGEQNQDNIVLCHSNKLKHGKGRGVKAHDLPCYLCPTCHDIVDGRLAPHFTQQDRDLIHYEGVFNSVLWLLRIGRWK